MKKQIRVILLEQINKDRKDEVINRDHVKRAINSYIDMGLKNAKPIKQPTGFEWRGERKIDVFEKDFEKDFLN